MNKKVLEIMLVSISIMLISACGKKEKLYEIPDLSQYKTEHIYAEIIICRITSNGRSRENETERRNE